MKPAAARRVEREIKAIMRNDGDHCSICRKPFQHNSSTTGGTTKAGRSVLAGECCEAQVHHVILRGMFLDRMADDLVSAIPTSRGKSSAPADVERAIAGMRNIFADRQAMAKEIAQRAGLPNGRTKVSTQQTAWKDDDKRWFEQHPDRSHRLRQLIGDEAEATGFVDEVLPPHHELQVLVRQVRPGQRMRLPFGRNLGVPIPDDETVLHTLFDIVGGNAGDGKIISMEMMQRAVAKHASSGQA